jgi:hypothetical protein
MNKHNLEEIKNLERIIEHNLHLHETAKKEEEIIYYNRIVKLSNQYMKLTGHFYRRRV